MSPRVFFVFLNPFQDFPVVLKLRIQSASAGDMGSVLFPSDAHALPLLPAQTAHLGAPDCCPEFTLVGEGRELRPELQEPWWVGWAPGRSQDLQA